MRDSGRMLRRREFLGQAGAVTIGCSIAGNTSASIDSRESKVDLLQLSHEQWAMLVGVRFAVRSEQTAALASIELVLANVHLIEAIDHAERPVSCRQQPFSLLFESRDGTRIANATHLITNREVGDFPLFLHESVRSNQTGTVWYEAVFG